MRDSTTTPRKLEKCWTSSCESRVQLEIKSKGMNSSITKMKEEEDDRYKQFNERIKNKENSLTLKNTKVEVKKPKVNMLIRIKEEQW